MNKKKGISLVALVITIIVLIILTGTVVLTMINTGMIDKSKEAVEAHNKDEVYNAVQQEVQAIRMENIGLPIGTEFARILDTKLKEKYPNANTSALFSTDRINIQFTVDNKEYSLELKGEGYILTIVENNGGTAVPSYESVVTESLDPELWVTQPDSEDSTKCIIVGYKGTGAQLSNIVIPNKIGDTVVSKLGDNQNPVFIYDNAGNNQWQPVTFTGDTITISDGIDIGANAFVMNYQTVSKMIIGKNCTLNPGSISGSFKNNELELTIGAKATITGSGFVQWTTCKKITVDPSVSLIEHDCFSGCTAILDIGFQAGAQIGSGAFSSSSLTSVTIPAGVTVGEYAFNNCENLSSVTIENGADLTGGISAFSDCTSLSTVIIGNEVKIANYMFSGCSGLTSVTMGTGCTLGAGVFIDCPQAIQDKYSDS